MSTNNLDPLKFYGPAEAIFQEAKQETIKLLKEKGEKCFITLKNQWWEFECDHVPLPVFGVGLNESDELLIAASLKNINPMFSSYQFPQGFKSIEDEDIIFPTFNFIGLYHFVAENINEATTREEAEKVFPYYYRKSKRRRNPTANKYNDAVQAINEEAKQETINLLKKKGDKCFIAFDNWQAEAEAHCNDVTISIFGVGLSGYGELLVAACVDNIGKGFSPDDFPQGFTSTNDLNSDCFPDIYRFVANNISESTTREEAEKVFSYYYGEDDEDEEEYEDEYEEEQDDEEEED